MRYLLTIYHDEKARGERDRVAAKATVDAYWALDAEARERGAFVESAGLEPTSAARTVRIRDGERILSDGPFAETKEQLGGFYLLECQDIDEALEWAAKIPAAKHGSVEVRRVVDYEAEGFPDPFKESSRPA